MQIVERQRNWWDPIIPRVRGQIAAEETADGLGFAGERRLKWYIDDPHDLERIMRGLACQHCLQAFPAPVGLVDIGEWRREVHRFRGMNREDVLRKVALGLCPTCGRETTPEVAQRDNMPTEPGQTPLEDAAASLYESREERDKRQAQQGGWIRNKRRGS